MSKSEFWQLTWLEFYEHRYRWEEEQYAWDVRFGVVAAAYINCHLEKNADPIPPGVLFGYAAPQPREMTPEETADYFASIAAAYNRHIDNVGKTQKVIIK
jgi:hypothetical protein